MAQLDHTSIEVATKLAIDRRQLDLLAALLRVGMGPSRPYSEFVCTGVGARTPLDHARRIGWDDGIALMAGIN